MSEKVNKAIENYSKKHGDYEIFTKKVESLIKEIINIEVINYSDITSRTKSILEYSKKAKKEKYTDPEKEIFDMSGIRIILYTNSDVKKTWEVIQKSFLILPEHTIDKGLELGVDKMGYRSLHCVAMFDEKRANLPEFKPYKDYCFEVQIRTILQHAWAEFEHDKNYKFSGILPDNVKRRLSILSGILELTDNEFDKISQEIDQYSIEVSEKTVRGLYDIQITTISLMDYMSSKFDALLNNKKIIYLIDTEKVINDLYKMKIYTIRQINDILPNNYIEIFSNLSDSRGQDDYDLQTVIGHIMWIYDAELYFSNVWNNNYILGLYRKYIDVFNFMGIDLLYILQENDVNHIFVDDE